MLAPGSPPARPRPHRTTAAPPTRHPRAHPARGIKRKKKVNKKNLRGEGRRARIDETPRTRRGGGEGKYEKSLVKQRRQNKPAVSTRQESEWGEGCTLVPAPPRPATSPLFLIRLGWSCRWERRCPDDGGGWPLRRGPLRLARVGPPRLPSPGRLVPPEASPAAAQAAAARNTTPSWAQTCRAGRRTAHQHKHPAGTHARRPRGGVAGRVRGFAPRRLDRKPAALGG